MKLFASWTALPYVTDIKNKDPFDFIKDMSYLLNFLYYHRVALFQAMSYV